VPKTPDPDAARDNVLLRVARQLESARVTVDNARRAVLCPAGLRGTALEAAWVGLHLAMYPFNLTQEHSLDALHRTALEHLPPQQRGLLVSDVEAAGTPILLVHGIADNRSIFTMLRRGLRRRGFGVIASFNYSSLTGDLRAVADRLRAAVEQLCEETGYERIHVVGHSMGGIVARYYVQRLAGDARVHTLVTLGSPHSGTAPARFLPHPLARALRPGSEILTELAEPAPDCRTRFVGIWSDLDQLVIPKRSARIEHPDLNARNVFVRGIGHMSLPVDGRVVHEICTTLAHIDVDGQVVADGATSITSATGHRGSRVDATHLDTAATAPTRTAGA
jgi:pimeloyl-ACP methyl ester carboxylesterase